MLKTKSKTQSVNSFGITIMYLSIYFFRGSVCRTGNCRGYCNNFQGGKFVTGQSRHTHIQ